MGHLDGSDEPVSRRRALLRLGGLAVGALGAGAWASRELRDASDADAAVAGPAGVAAGLVSCVLTPEQTEGPYFLEGDRVRRNITEGKPGVPLVLRLTVLDVSTCRPIRNAALDVWHCDAAGVYSGVQGDRGDLPARHPADEREGRRRLPDDLPGLVPGAHVKVALGGNVVHTGQLYFPDRVTDAVYRRAPYDRRPNRSPRNGGDSVYRNGGSRSTLRLVRDGSAYVGSLAMGVQRS